ncbi:hypothetical protein BBW65_06835 [Helicobacter enhydrae]|uniref:Uncharacterized protein n=1 Tax=Helicobacter enhydrae TaxID=222136 RepID=A0A1B1U710_9HELI|nr:hypothetical protein [Helicobacter enhydrae]ANV98526.1 hypothetical protein BBW65_06835 [Helicobacter enhydrae]
MAKVSKSIIKTLLKHGFTQEDLDAKDAESILQIYKKGIEGYVQNFSAHHKKEHTPRETKSPFGHLERLEEVYDLPTNYFTHFSQEDIVLLLHKKFRSIPINRIQKIVNILMVCFQERILGEIYEKTHDLPREEQENIMEIYEIQKDNIAHLVQINDRLQSAKFRKQLQEVISIKNQIQRIQNTEEDED